VGNQRRGLASSRNAVLRSRKSLRKSSTGGALGGGRLVIQRSSEGPEQRDLTGQPRYVYLAIPGGGTGSSTLVSHVATPRLQTPGLLRDWCMTRDGAITQEPNYASHPEWLRSAAYVFAVRRHGGGAAAGRYPKYHQLCPTLIPDAGSAKTASSWLSSSRASAWPCLRYNF